MENENLVEPTKSSHSLTNFLIVLLVIIGVGYLVVDYKNKKFVPTMEQSRNALLKDSTFSINPASQFETVGSDTLPKDLQPLLSFDVENLVVQKGKNEVGKTLYKSSFIANTSLFSYYQTNRTLLNNNKDWSVTRTSRSNTFAVTEAESKSYSIQIQVSYLSDDSVDVLIGIQQK